jgi:DNA-binding transcriptional regulator Cro
MNFDELMRHFGTQRAVAEALDFHYQAVNNWMIRGRIPWRSQVRLEKITQGRLRADPYPGRKINGRR